MPNEYTVQTSYHFGRPDWRGLPQDLLNIRMDDVAELPAIYDALEPQIPRIVGLSETIQALDNLSKGGVQGETKGHVVSSFNPESPTQPLMSAPTPAMSCPHGYRIHRTGTGARGPWQGWFCPLPQGAPDQCKPIFKSA